QYCEAQHPLCPVRCGRRNYYRFWGSLLHSGPRRDVRNPEKEDNGTLIGINRVGPREPRAFTGCSHYLQRLDFAVLTQRYHSISWGLAQAYTKYRPSRDFYSGCPSIRKTSSSCGLIGKFSVSPVGSRSRRQNCRRRGAAVAASSRLRP